jgi:hypothetical protein
MSAPEQVEKGPQWTNSYEAQLSDATLQWLHTALRTRNPSDKEILRRLPPWKTGRWAGQPPSPATLSNIRDRLELEEDFQANEQTVESMLEAERAANPNITQEELDRQGLKLFTLLSIRKRDTKSFVSLQRSQKDREALKLDQARFRRETCELFLQWAADQRAKDIAAGPASNAEKIEQLGALMFGEDWHAQPEAKAT